MMTETVPKFITIFEKYMADFGKEGFMVGNKVRKHDFGYCAVTARLMMSVYRQSRSCTPK